MYCGKEATTMRQNKIKLVSLRHVQNISSRTASRRVRCYEFFATKLGRWLVFVDIPSDSNKRMAMRK